MLLARMTELVKELVSPESLMAIRVLAAGEGGPQGSFSAGGISIHIAADPPQVPLEEAKVLLQQPMTPLTMDDRLDGQNIDPEALAVYLSNADVSENDLKDYLVYCREVAARIFQDTGGVWKINQYGPNNDQTITFEEFLEGWARAN
jgi:hypothetical protein